MLRSTQFRNVHRDDYDETGASEHQGAGSWGNLHTSDYMLNQVLNDEHTEEGKGSLGPGRKNRRYKSTDV